MRFNNRFTMRELFMNPEMAKVFPQFTQNDAAKKSLSDKEIMRRVTDFLKGAFQAREDGGGQLRVKGHHAGIVARIRALRVALEGMLSNTDEIAGNLNSSAGVYISAVSKSELADMNLFDSADIMQEVLDNLMYNPNFANGRTAIRSSEFIRLQNDWKRKVGFKEI